MNAVGVYLLVGSQNNIFPGGYIEVLGILRRQSGQHQLCFGVHPLDAPGHILPAGGEKTFCSRPYLQG